MGLLGKHLFNSLSMTQSEVSMSTGQAEYNGVIRGCIEVLYLKNLLEFFNHHVKAVVKTDSSAAKGNH